MNRSVNGHYTEPGDHGGSGRRPQLHLCPRCGSRLVHPLDWERRAIGWRVALRCPECETRRTGTFGKPVMEAFEDELCRADEEIVEALQLLEGTSRSELGVVFAFEHRVASSARGGE